jgi:N-ethylmaleimide reductase
MPVRYLTSLLAPKSVALIGARNRPGCLGANNGYTRDMAIAAVAGGAVDLIAFGRPLIANPDLVSRLQLNAPLNDLVNATLYGGGAEGYTDYPAMTAAEA